MYRTHPQSCQNCFAQCNIFRQFNIVVQVYGTIGHLLCVYISLGDNKLNTIMKKDSVNIYFRLF